MNEQPIEWYAVRHKPTVNPNRSTAVLGGRFAKYRDRAGRERQRRIKGTGERKYVIETLLRRQGFEIFFPTQKVWRFYDWKRRLKHQVDLPKAPGWIFVGWCEGENRWHDLFASGVVLEVAGIANRPVRISQNAIDDLQQRWGGKKAPAHEQFMQTHHEFKIGDLIKISTGPLDGIGGRVTDLRGPRAQVLVDMLGGPQKIEIDAMALEAA